MSSGYGDMGLCQWSQLLPSGSLCTLSSVGIHSMKNVEMFVGEMSLHILYAYDITSACHILVLLLFIW